MRETRYRLWIINQWVNFTTTQHCPSFTAPYQPKLHKHNSLQGKKKSNFFGENCQKGSFKQSHCDWYKNYLVKMDAELSVFTQSMLFLVTCWACAELIRARLKKLQTSQVLTSAHTWEECTALDSSGCWGPMGRHNTVASVVQRKVKGWFLMHQLRDWAGASSISVYIHTSGIFVKFYSDLSIMVPFWIIHTSQ